MSKYCHVTQFRPARKKVALFLLSVIAITCQGRPTLAATVTVMHGWPSQQGDAFQKIVAAFETLHKDIKVQVEVVGRDRPAILATRLAAGNPPDITPHPWLGLQRQWARQGQIVALDGLVDPGDLLEALQPLGYVDGHLYGLFIFPNVKSLIWYNKKAFSNRGYTVPKSWNELTTLGRKMAADGVVPWSIGLESGAASGWPGTDWIEDILLHESGPDIYDQWVNHSIPWTHRAVRSAFERFGGIVKDARLTLGGPVGALTTNFGDAVSALFTEPPQAYLHHQATFIQGFIRRQHPGLVAGEDYDIFAFPAFKPGDGASPVLISGDVVNLFSDRPEVVTFVRYLISREAQAIWVRELGELSSNRKTDPALYTDPVTLKAWRILSSAQVSRYDGSDMMPAAVGAGAFWTGVLDYVSGTPLDQVLDRLETSARDAYEGP